jgi:KDO2-lipid IV(A) lauroyltransferase
MSAEHNEPHTPPANGARARDVYVRRVVATAFQILGPDRAGAFARWLGNGLFDFCHADRRTAEQHLNAAFGPGLAPSTRDALVRASFRYAAHVWIDLPFARRKFAGRAWQDHVANENGHNLIDRLRHERGAILATPHFGNPAIAAYLLACATPDLAMIVDTALDPGSTRWTADLAGQQSFMIWTPDRAAREAEPWLERGGKLFVIGDHFRATARGPRVPYLGSERTFFPTLALWACRCDVPILVISCRRRERGYHFVLSAHGVVEPHPDADDAVAAMTAEYAAVMDAVVRRHPEQYYWIRKWNDDTQHTAPTKEKE